MRLTWQERTVAKAESVRRSQARALALVTDVVTTARQLLLEQGSEGFTIQELADRAGVAVQTFYRYFRTKDELLLVVFEDLLHEGTDRLRQAAIPLRSRSIGFVSSSRNRFYPLESARTGWILRPWFESTI